MERDMSKIEPYNMPMNVNVWLSSPSVMMMTPAERGGYFHLLCYCWKMDGLPDDDEQLAILSDLRADWSKGSGDKIRKCFLKIRGKLYSKRLMEERKKSVELIKKCRDAGLTSAKARQEKKLDAAQPVNKRSTRVATDVQPAFNKRSNGCSTSVATVVQPALQQAFNERSNQYKHKVLCNNTHNQNKDCKSLMAGQATGSKGLDCIDLGGKKIQLPDEMLAARKAAKAVLEDRFKPLNGTAKVMEDILNAAVRRAITSGDLGVFDKMASTARRMVADERVENPTGRFVAWAKRTVGYVPTGKGGAK